MFMVLFTHRLPILFSYVHGFVCTHMMIYMYVYIYIYIYIYGVTTVWMFHVIPILNSCGYSSANPHKIRYFIGHLIGLPVKAFAKIQLSIIYSPLTSVLEPIFSQVIPIKEKRPWSGGRPKKIHCMKTRNTKSISQRIFMGGKVAVLAPSPSFYQLFSRFGHSHRVCLRLNPWQWKIRWVFISMRTEERIKDIWGFPKLGVPQNGWLIREIPSKWMITRGTPMTQEPPCTDVLRDYIITSQTL